MKEVRASLQTIRPGRTLFVREWILGVEETADDEHAKSAVGLQIIIVHGSCASEAQFHLFLLSLEAKLQAVGDIKNKKKAIRCVLFDAVGCGRSPLVQNDKEAYSPENTMLDMQVLVETYMDESMPLIWMGHSYGPSLFLRLYSTASATSSSSSSFVQKYPPAGFLLLSTAVRPSQRPDPSFFPDGGLTIFQLPLFLLHCLQHFMTTQFVKMAIHPKHAWLRSVTMEASASNSMYMVKSFYQQTVWATEHDLIQVLVHQQQQQNSRCNSIPVLVVHGVDDGVVNIKYGQDLVNAIDTAAAAASNANTPPTKFVPIEEASHLVMMEQADKVATSVLDFLQTHFLDKQ